MGCNVLHNMRGKVTSQILGEKPRYMKGDLLRVLIMHNLISEWNNFHYK
jgi:hypothetical protein